MSTIPKLVRLFAIVSLIAGAIAAAMGQTPPAGTVVTVTSTTVTGTTPTVVCVIANSTPILVSGVHIECSVTGVKILVMDSVIPVGTPGMDGNFGNSGNTVNWSITKPTEQGPIAWSMAANGVTRSGTF